MYRGFKVKVSQTNLQGGADAPSGREQAVRAPIREALRKYAVDGKLQADRIVDDWFPRVETDVFLSHSHADESLAKRLAGYLHQNFGLRTFIDSDVWGYADELLKLIDNRFCRNASENTYSYELRNKSTSHVHMMLTVALTEMLDDTECVFFLNTPNSLSTSDVVGENVGDVTPSPWLYAEIAMTRMLREREPKRRVEKRLKLSEGRRVDASVPIVYNVYTGHLADLSFSQLEAWRRNSSGAKSGPERLDNLYDMMATA